MLRSFSPTRLSWRPWQLKLKIKRHQFRPWRPSQTLLHENTKIWTNSTSEGDCIPFVSKVFSRKSHWISILITLSISCSSESSDKEIDSLQLLLPNLLLFFSFQSKVKEIIEQHSLVNNQFVSHNKTDFHTWLTQRVGSEGSFTSSGLRTYANQEEEKGGVLWSWVTKQQEKRQSQLNPWKNR